MIPTIEPKPILVNCCCSHCGAELPPIDKELLRMAVAHGFERVCTTCGEAQRNNDEHADETRDEGEGE